MLLELRGRGIQRGKKDEPRSIRRGQWRSTHQGWSLEEKGGVKVQLQVETSAVPGCRLGYGNGPPLPTWEQFISQVGWSISCDRGAWEWGVQARDLRRWDNSSNLERRQPKILFQIILSLYAIKGTLFFPYQGFLMRSPNKKLIEKYICKCVVQCS